MALRDLANETAEALLSAIKAEAEDKTSTGAGKLLDLASAYAQVMGAKPGPVKRVSSSGRRAVVVPPRG